MITTSYTPLEVSNIIRDYHWMINEIKRINFVLNDTDQKVTASYGIEASMPKAKGDPADTIAFEVIRREKKSKRVTKLEKKIKFIQDNLHKVQDERQKVVLDCLLDGMSITKVAYHMGLSRKHIHTIKEQIVETLLN